MTVSEADEETQLVVTVGGVPSVPVSVEVEFISDTAQGTSVM